MMEERRELIEKLLSDPHNAQGLEEWVAKREEMNQASAAASMDTDKFLASLSPVEFQEMMDDLNINSQSYQTPTLKRSSRSEGLESRPVELKGDCGLERQIDDVNQKDNTFSVKREEPMNLDNLKLLSPVEQTVGKTTPVKEQLHLEKSEGLSVNSEASEIHSDSLSMDSGRTSDNNYSSNSSVNDQCPSVGQLQQPGTPILTERGGPVEQESMPETSNTANIGSQFERGCHSCCHNQIQSQQNTIVLKFLEVLQTQQNRNQLQNNGSVQHMTAVHANLKTQNIAMGKKVASLQIDCARMEGLVQSMEDEIEKRTAVMQRFLQLYDDRRKENKKLKEESNSVRGKIYQIAEKLEGTSVKMKDNSKGSQKDFSTEGTELSASVDEKNDKLKKVQEEKQQSEHKYAELLKENELLKKKNSFLEEKVKSLEKQEKKDHKMEETEFSADEEGNKRIEEVEEVLNELRDLNEQLESPWFGSSDTEERSHEKKSEPDQE